MKNNKIVLSIMFLITILLFGVYSCTPDITPSLTDYAGDKGVAPIITSVTPSSGYSGVTTITVSGTGFSTVAEENSIYFSSAKAEVLSASETELIVKAPIILGDSLRLKIRIDGVEDYSNTVYYKLTSAVNQYYPFLGNQEAYVATSDAAGNLYFSYIESAVGKGIYKISSDGILSEFAPKGGETKFFDLKYHSDGYLIGVYGNKATFKIEEGVKPAVFANTGNNSIKLSTIDFDSEKNLWAAGKGGYLVSVKPDKSFKLFEYAENISGIRVFDSYLYAISGESNFQSVVRFPIISADSLGEVESVFAFSSELGAGKVANRLTFSSTGQMYIATSELLPTSDPVDPVIYVNTNGSFGTWYPGLINSSISSFTWGTGTEMFMIQDRYPADRAVEATFSQSIIKVDMERLGAPEFGRD